MREKVINYGIQELALALFSADDDGADLVELAYDDAQKSIESDYKSFYDALTAGRIDCFYYEKGANVYSFTRSTRAGVTVQKTCFWKRGGDLLPLSHRDINGFRDVIADGLADNVTLTAA